MAPFSVNIPGEHEKVYSVNIENINDFAIVKIDLLNISGVEDATFNHQMSPPEITLFTNGMVTDAAIQEAVAKHGFNASPKTFLIS